MFNLMPFGAGASVSLIINFLIIGVPFFILLWVIAACWTANSSHREEKHKQAEKELENAEQLGFYQRHLFQFGEKHSISAEEIEKANKNMVAVNNPILWEKEFQMFKSDFYEKRNAEASA